MQYHEFIREYANMPIQQRHQLINTIKYGLLTPTGLHRQLSHLEELMRPLRIEQERLLKIADDFFKYGKPI